MKKELLKHNWDFTLYEVNEMRILSVVFYNSFADTSRCFSLNEDEENFDLDELKVLSDDIRKNTDKYINREVEPDIRYDTK